jgi:hypothetical protein
MFSGTLKFPPVIKNPSGWVAVYSGISGQQPLAECRFSGNPAAVSLTYNLPNDWVFGGKVEIQVLDEMFVVQARQTCADLEAAKGLLAEGWDVPVARCDVSIPDLPSGAVVATFVLARRGEQFTRPMPRAGGGAREVLWLGSGDFVVHGENREKMQRAYGVLIRDGGTEHQMGAVVWYVSLPGPASQELLVTDEDGAPLSNEAIAYRRLTVGNPATDGLLSGVVMSDDNGSAALRDVVEGQYSLRASRPFVDEHQPRIINVPSKLVHVRLARKTVVWIAPRMQVNLPLVEQYSVYTRAVGSAEAWRHHQIDARFGGRPIGGLRPGSYDVFVHANPMLGMGRISVEAHGQRQEFEIPVGLPAMVFGTIIDNSGSPVANRVVWASESQTGTGCFEWLRAVTDGQGGFALCSEGIAAKYLVVFDSAGTVPARAVPYADGSRIVVE